MDDIVMNAILESNKLGINGIIIETAFYSSWIDNGKIIEKIILSPKMIEAENEK